MLPTPAASRCSRSRVYEWLETELAARAVAGEPDGHCRLSPGASRGSAAYSGSTSDEAVTSEQVEEIRRLYEVQPRGWLELEPAYAGDGVTHFTTNPGTITGPTSVRYAEDGSLLEFRMTVEHLEADTPIAGLDSPFVFVNMLPIPGEPGSFGMGGRSNECASVEVSGEGFTLAPAQRSSVIASAGDDGVVFRQELLSY